MKRPKLNTKAEERTEGDILDKEERQTGKAENPNGTPANSFWDQILWETLFAGEHDFTWQTAIHSMQEEHVWYSPFWAASEKNCMLLLHI